MIKKKLLIKVLTLLFFAVGPGLSGYSQTANAPAVNYKNKDSVLSWVKDLYQPGVEIKGDSLLVSKESEQLINNKEYRQVMYPSVYTWDVAKEFVQKQEIKKALWFFINLYLARQENKEIVVKSLLVYNKVFKMDKMLVSAFYTYILTDPEIGMIEEGRSEITAPQVMEKKINALKEMLFYLDKYKTKDVKEESANH